MASSELYHVKQQFLPRRVQVPHRPLAARPSSPDYIPTLVYQAPVASLVPAASENVSVKSGFLPWRATFSAADSAKQEAALEELRDLAVEIEGRTSKATEHDNFRSIEEALETLFAETEDLEAVGRDRADLPVHKPNRPRQEGIRPRKQWAEDDLLLQLIESSIGLVAAKDGYSNPNSFYTEQLGNPSLSSPHIPYCTRQAKSDLEESLEQQKADAETLAAFVVAAGIESKRGEADELRLQTEHPAHPLVLDVAQKAALFDESAAKFTVPPLAVAAAA
ncbi:hypothetical protein B0H16DRAFT_1668863 [Mycena metata]|uniref:Uncharacterized protein n=1 Tax=Mycena metata TaxID=1033252 RepID=A0AAD7GKD4_9AGAR|nr:hypothetical protein B0H16DRAFT_1668863 [Mycena metata]